MPDANAGKIPSPARNGMRFIRDPVFLSAAFVVVVSVIFLSYPDLDLQFSALFWHADGGFTLAQAKPLVLLRRSGNTIVAVIAIVLVASLIARPFWPKGRLIPPQVSLFLLTTLTLGPGILVNLILKDHWGRPRPPMVMAFGGSDPLVPVWEITGYCARNCSFVGGEASSAIWLTAIALVVPAKWRLPTAIVTLVYAFALSLNRIVMGGHFLSDVLLAWGLTWLVIGICYRFMIEQPPAWLTEQRLAAAFEQANARLTSRKG